MSRINLSTTVSALALGAFLLGSAPSYADELQSKDVLAASTPVTGQQTVTVSETLHFVHHPFLFWQSDTYSTKSRTVTATFVSRLGYFVVRDSEGDWYAISPGSTAATKLPGKPQADAGAQAHTLSSDDSGSLSAVSGAAGLTAPVLNVTYSYTHSEPLDDVTYTVTGPVNPTYVPDQRAWFAWLSGHLYGVDAGGHATAYNAKPLVDRGWVGNLIGSGDSKISTDNVTANGGNFLVTGTFVHSDTFEDIRYQAQTVVAGDWVADEHAYMAWIDRVEYMASPGSTRAVPLARKPVENFGGQTARLVGDSAYRTDVYSVSDTTVVVRYFYQNDGTYVTKNYYVDHVGVMYFNTTYQVWMVAIDGNSYAVAWDGDSVNDSSVTVLHAPAGSVRPQYVVPSNTGDGLPPAVVPGAERSNAGAPPPPAFNGGIPGRTSTGIPGRAPASNCIPGRSC